MRDVIIGSNTLRACIKEKLVERELSYATVVKMAKDDGISIAKSNLANYLNNKPSGTLTQLALLYLSMKLDVRIAIQVHHVVSEKEKEFLQKKLKNLLENESINRPSDVKTGEDKAE